MTFPETGRSIEIGRMELPTSGGRKKRSGIPWDSVSEI